MAAPRNIGDAIARALLFAGENYLPMSQFNTRNRMAKEEQSYRRDRDTVSDQRYADQQKRQEQLDADKATREHQEFIANLAPKEPSSPNTIEEYIVRLMFGGAAPTDPRIQNAAGIKKSLYKQPAPRARKTPPDLIGEFRQNVEKEKAAYLRNKKSYEEPEVSGVDEHGRGIMKSKQYPQSAPDAAALFRSGVLPRAGTLGLNADSLAKLASQLYPEIGGQQQGGEQQGGYGPDGSFPTEEDYQKAKAMGIVQ
ncbi:MAG: hypothetical protein P1R58_11725 [bacterium]|nr:hypothetical protein [bacterium]